MVRFISHILQGQGLNFGVFLNRPSSDGAQGALVVFRASMNRLGFVDCLSSRGIIGKLGGAKLIFYSLLRSHNVLMMLERMAVVEEVAFVVQSLILQHRLLGVVLTFVSTLGSMEVSGHLQGRASIFVGKVVQRLAHIPGFAGHVVDRRQEVGPTKCLIPARRIIILLVF